MAQLRSSWSFNNEGVGTAEPHPDVLAPEQHSMVVPAHTPFQTRDDTETILESGAAPAFPSAGLLQVRDDGETVSEVLIDALVGLGVTDGFGLMGGAIAPLGEALHRSPIRFVHFRQESGAAFAAIESSLANQRLALVVATSGPGLTNLYTGMVAARREGAKVLFVTGCTPAAQRGRGAFQETSYGMGDLTSLFTPGALFHHASVLEDHAELGPTIARVISGASRPQGFVAPLAIPLALQTTRGPRTRTARLTTVPPSSCDAVTLDACAEMLRRESLVVWLGYGARNCSDAIRRLVQCTGARVICTPRAKGIFPEDAPEFLGVTGLGGRESVLHQLVEAPPDRILVLGTRMGEFSSFWIRAFTPRRGFIHVDLEVAAFGAAYPDVPTLGIQAEIGSFLAALLSRLPMSRPVTVTSTTPITPMIEAPSVPRTTGPVRPSYLMHSIQREIVERSDAIVLTEAGNSFALGSYHLRFKQPGRYRVSTGFGSMGHAAAGVLGAALGARRKAVAIVGDGSMLMLNEMNTAASYGIDAVWLVLNDARYGMIAQGMQAIGWKPFGTDFPRTDFVAIARAMGCDGIRVDQETQVDGALKRAMTVSGPFLVDVIIDPDEPSPPNPRNASLVKQGIKGNTSRQGAK